MTGTPLRLLALAFQGTLALACSHGGQTYDDGSDGVVRGDPTSSSSEDDTAGSSEETTAAPETDPSESGAGGGSGGEAAGGNGPAAGGNPAVGGSGGTAPAGGSSNNGGASCEALDAEVAGALEEALQNADTSCTADEDCTITSARPSCLSGCTGPSVVSVDGAAAVDAAMEEIDATTCAEFNDSMCARTQTPCPAALVAAPVCENGQCTNQPMNGTAGASGNGGAGGSAPQAECYGPEQNISQAYSGTIDGCPCGDVGDICSGAVALICEAGTWRAVEDGPCEPNIRDNACDGRVVSADTCVELFDNCFDLSTDLFCGVGHRTTLCEGGEISEGSDGCLQDTSCFELENGLWCSGVPDENPAMCPEGYVDVTAEQEACPPDSSTCVEVGDFPTLICQLQVISAQECSDLGGEILVDPGDGSLISAGCPDNRDLLALVSGCDEGCLCCAP